MKLIKTLRFILPPLILLAVLVWLAVADPNFPVRTFVERLNSDEGRSRMAAVILGLFVTMGAGVALINWIPRLLLPTLAGAKAAEVLAADAGDPTFKAIRAYADRGFNLYSVASYAHRLLGRESPALNARLELRWNLFLLAVQSCIALLIGHAVGVALQYGVGIRLPPEYGYEVTAGWDLWSRCLIRWWLPDSILFCLFAYFAVIYRTQYWRFVSYILRRLPKEPTAPAPEN